MKHTTTYLAAVVAAMILILTGCQNDGPIGYKFGVWRVDSYTADGSPVDNPLIAKTTIAFQGGVINVVTPYDDYMNSYDQYGSWSEEGDILYLNFTHSDDLRPSGTDLYSAPSWLGWTSEKVMEMTVESHTSQEMTWRYVSTDGTVNIYKLHKTW